MQSTQDAENTAKIIKRFWRKVDKTNSCWNWTAGLTTDLYGKFHPSHLKTVRAHRFSYELKYGKISEHKLVCHTCDNRLCVNPDHLFTGTYLDNNRDRNQKGRQAKGKKHGRSILTENDVIEIRSTKGKTTELARKFGVHSDTILKVRRRDIWKHV